MRAKEKIADLEEQVEKLKRQLEMSRHREYSLGAAVASVLYNPFVVPDMKYVQHPDGSTTVKLEMDMTFEDTIKLQEFFDIKRKNIQIGENW